MKVSEWVRYHPEMAMTVAPDMTKEQVVDGMLAEPALRDIYVVAGDQRVLGHISHKKLATLFLAEHCPVQTRRQIIARVTADKARDLMDGSFPYAGLDEDLESVLHRQLEHEVEDMPVLDDQGILLGTVNMSAVLRAFRRGELDGGPPV